MKTEPTLKRHSKSTLLVTVASTLAVSGCAVVHSDKLNSSAGSTEGMVYYLPKKLMKVEFVRAPAPTKPELEKALAALAAASGAHELAEKGVEEAGARHQAAAPGSPAATATLKVLELAKVDLKLAKTALDEAKTKAVKAKQQHDEAVAGKPQLVDTLTFTVLPSVADPAHRYAARLQHSPGRSDTLELKTNPAGLLTNSSSIAADQSAQILLSLAQSYSAVRTGAGTSGPGFRISSASPKDVPPDDGKMKCPNGMMRDAKMNAVPFKLELTFDPAAPSVDFLMPGDKGTPTATNIDPWRYLESVLCAKGADYRFAWTNPSLGAAGTPIDARDGLLYRRNLPHTLGIYRGERDSGDEWKTLQPVRTVSFDLPNSSPAELLKMSAGMFVTNESTTEFQEGILVSHKDVKPSELLAIAKVPYDIAKALISIPAEILSLKVNYSTKEKELTDARAALIAAQKALKAAEDAAGKPASD